VQAFHLGPYAQPPLAQAAAPTKPDLSYQASSNLFTLGKGRMLDTDNPNAVSIYILVILMINYLGGASKFNDRIRVGVPQTFCKEANESWLYLTNSTRRPTGNTHREPWCSQHRLCDRLHIILDLVAGPCCGEHHLAKNTRPTDCVVAALS
jgi:hypothetical protein